MRTRSGLVALIVSASLATLATPAPAARAASTAPITGCAAALTCTAEQINAMSMPDRLTFVRAISADAAPGYAPRWGSVEGVIEFFNNRKLGAAGSWVSYVDAGDLEAVERGIAIAEGRGTDTYGNPGSVMWASYLQRLRAGELADRSAHDRAWSEADQASVDAGVVLAEHVHGRTPTPAEQRFFGFTQFYRWVLRNRPFPLDLGSAPIAPGSAPRQTTFLDWFTDVTNDAPSREGASFGYDAAGFDAKAGAADLAEILRSYATYFVKGSSIPRRTSGAGH